MKPQTVKTINSVATVMAATPLITAAMYGLVAFLTWEFPGWWLLRYFAVLSLFFSIAWVIAKDWLK
jgi:uncharacterized membrane protein HdeD (DUF308 family)